MGWPACGAGSSRMMLTAVLADGMWPCWQERELHEAQSKYKNLKADFQYNLKLIEDRDAELKRNDAAFVNLQEAIRQRDTHISDLRVKVSNVCVCASSSVFAGLH